MSKRTYRRGAFIKYLATHPECLFIYSRNLRGAPIPQVEYKDVENLEDLKDNVLANVMSLKIAPAGIVALFPRYLVFFTEGKKKFHAGGMIAKSMMYGLAQPALDLYEAAEGIAHLGGDLMGRVKKEKKIPIKNVFNWLIDENSFVIPVSKIDSIEVSLRGVRIQEKDGTQYEIMSGRSLIRWDKKLIKEFEKLVRG